MVATQVNDTGGAEHQKRGRTFAARPDEKRGPEENSGE
jgi:hypothetical protein